MQVQPTVAAWTFFSIVLQGGQVFTAVYNYVKIVKITNIYEKRAYSI
jgi:hypothetical protein